MKKDGGEMADIGAAQNSPEYATKCPELQPNARKKKETNLPMRLSVEEKTPMKRTVHSLRAVLPLCSSKTRASRRSTLPTRRGATLRAKRVQHIKEQINTGTYEISATDVVRGIARSELFWLLSMDYPRLRPVLPLPPV
jgi:anti-sigma28 factor (negative regulator of flagellin synthesis)